MLNKTFRALFDGKGQMGSVRGPHFQYWRTAAPLADAASFNF